MREIKIIGRGGQGAKSAASILADAAMEKGFFIQSFPEYGAERQGAPVFAYTRIDDKEIRIHSSVKNPEIVVVIDSTLLSAVNVTEGMSDTGILIVNTNKTPAEIRSKINFKTGKVFTVDATRISKECLGVNIPNTPMLGAIEKAANLVGLDTIKEKIKEKFQRKIGDQGIEKNIRALDMAYAEVVQG